MTSFKSKIFNFLIRNRHLFQGRLSREAFDFNTSIAGFREQCEKGAARFGKITPDIIVKEQIVRNVKAEWLTPAGVEPDKLMLYIHGGGYVSGSCSDHRGVVAKFVKLTGFTALHFEYRLAPEFPFPAALDDSVSVYQWLLSTGFHPEKILIAGESAGGGLTLATLLALKQREIPMPVAAVAISPWTDLTCSSDSYKTKNILSVAPLNSWTVFSAYYAKGSDPANPLISPLFGDLRGLPPILINAGVDDELFEDGEKFYLKAREANVDITFRPGPGMIHCYPLMAPMFREATEAMEEIVSFIQKHLK